MPDLQIQNHAPVPGKIATRYSSLVRVQKIPLRVLVRAQVQKIPLQVREQVQKIPQRVRAQVQKIPQRARYKCTLSSHHSILKVEDMHRRIV